VISFILTKMNARDQTTNTMLTYSEIR